MRAKHGVIKRFVELQNLFSTAQWNVKKKLKILVDGLSIHRGDDSPLTKSYILMNFAPLALHIVEQM
jgi:hypothetical protein